MTAITAGKVGVRELLRRYTIWRVGLRWYLLVLLGVPLFQLVCSSVFLGIAPLTAFIQQWPASQIGGYGLASALLFPLVAAVLLLIFTKGRLSYKPDRVVQSAEALRPAETPAANV